MFRRAGSNRWVIEYRPAPNVVRRLHTGLRDRRAAAVVLGRVEERVAMARMGLLAEHEIAAAEQRRTLAECLDRWARRARSLGRSPTYIDRVYRDVCRCADLGPVDRLDLINADLVSRFLLTGNIASSTARQRLSSIRTVLKWARRELHLPVDNAVFDLPRPRGRDTNRKRAALTEEEITRLLSYCLHAPSLMRATPMTGPQRRMMYLIVLETGLRRSEVCSLTHENLRLTDDRPHIYLPASAAKNRREAHLPVRETIACELLGWSQLQCPDVPFFDVPAVWAARLVRRDIHAAGIEIDPARGRMDFHALRHTFITRMVRQNAPPTVVQRLARHSDVRLTLQTYTHLQDEELRGWLDRLDPDAAAQTR
jgi:integrase